MRSIRKFICCLLIIACVLSTVNISSGATFYDLDEADAERIETVTDMGFLYYDLVPYFSPDRILTKKDAAEIMYIISKGYFYNDGDVSYISNFKDVYKNDYVINYCKESGLIRGEKGNIFKPNNPVTYEEIIEMFVKTLGLDNDKILDYPGEYISVARDAGLFNDIEFEQDDFVTNLNAAKMVYNALTLPLYPEKGKRNLLETRFDYIYKLTLQMNDRVERMLVMLEEFEANPDIVLINLDFDMILSCYKELAAININCEFKFNQNLQFLRRTNGYVNTISKLNNEITALEDVPVYLDFERLSSLAYEFSNCIALLETEHSYNDRYSKILLNFIYTMIEAYEKLLAGIDEKLPEMKHFVDLFSELEKDVLVIFEDSIVNKNIPFNFYDENSSVNMLITRYGNVEELYNFMTERNQFEDYTYYNKMLELTYVIKSIYVITGYDYSLMSDSPQENMVSGEYYEASRELFEEIKAYKFVHYEKQISEIIRKLDRMIDVVL